ncbi:MAG: P27 family phage terminase small subunit [Faecousia sp.]
MATKKEIRNSLVQQLKDKGSDALHFTALIDDYIFFYSMERRMQADIRKRGLEIEATSATGKQYTKENPSVKSAAMYNQRMLAILKEMGLTVDEYRPPDDDGGGLG